MPVAAGVAVATWMGATGVGAAIVVGAVSGAITGAAIGAVTAIVTKQDILKGALKGALIGGVTGGVINGVAQGAFSAGIGVSETAAASRAYEGGAGLWDSAKYGMANPNGLLQGAEAAKAATAAKTANLPSSAPPPSAAELAKMTPEQIAENSRLRTMADITAMNNKSLMNTTLATTAAGAGTQLVAGLATRGDAEDTAKATAEAQETARAAKLAANQPGDFYGVGPTISLSGGLPDKWNALLSGVDLTKYTNSKLYAPTGLLQKGAVA
jgi:hypothetical protein